MPQRIGNIALAAALSCAFVPEVGAALSRTGGFKWPDEGKEGVFQRGDAHGLALLCKEAENKYHHRTPGKCFLSDGENHGKEVEMYPSRSVQGGKPQFVALDKDKGIFCHMPRSTKGDNVQEKSQCVYLTWLIQVAGTAEANKANGYPITLGPPLTFPFGDFEFYTDRWVAFSLAALSPNSAIVCAAFAAKDAVTNQWVPFNQMPHKCAVMTVSGDQVTSSAFITQIGVGHSNVVTGLSAKLAVSCFVKANPDKQDSMSKQDASVDCVKLAVEGTKITTEKIPTTADWSAHTNQPVYLTSLVATRVSDTSLVMCYSLQYSETFVLCEHVSTTASQKNKQYLIGSKKGPHAVQVAKASDSNKVVVCWQGKTGGWPEEHCVDLDVSPSSCSIGASAWKNSRKVPRDSLHGVTYLSASKFMMCSGTMTMYTIGQTTPLDDGCDILTVADGSKACTEYTEGGAVVVNTPPKNTEGEGTVAASPVTLSGSLTFKADGATDDQAKAGVVAALAAATKLDPAKVKIVNFVKVAASNSSTSDFEYDVEYEVTALTSETAAASSGIAAAAFKTTLETELKKAGAASVSSIVVKASSTTGVPSKQSQVGSAPASVASLLWAMLLAHVVCS